MTSTEKPLVSLCLMCYNQEKYIEDAFRAALAQDYSPLEIIVSDDCSTDNSFSIIQAIAKEYKGPHKIILHRNETNKKISGNWSQLCSLANGELLVKADGDDISYPNRVISIVFDWIQNEKKAVLISHLSEKINLMNETLENTDNTVVGWDNRSKSDIYTGNGFFHSGAVSAYNRTLFDRFGEIEIYDAADDAVFVGRAILSGQIRVVGVPLVKYRIGSGETTLGKGYRRSMSRGLSLAAEANKQNLLDLEHIKNSLTEAQYKEFYEIFSSRLEHHLTVLKLYQGKSFRERLIGYKGTHKGAVLSKSWLVCVILLLPEKIGDWILRLMQKIQKLFR